jgi:V/A-type H+-transporting ATPase subunit E
MRERETERGKEKVKRICEILRKETLDPAKGEADTILSEARKKAEEIVDEAHRRSRQMLEETDQEIERRRSQCEVSLQHACKQAVLALRHRIEEQLFNRELLQMLGEPLREPNTLAQLIHAVVHALEKEGIETDLSIAIPAAVPARSVNQLLSQKIIDRLKEKSVVLSPIGGGITVKLWKEGMTLDLSDVALKELIGGYIRKDFREIFFGAL